MEDRLLHGQRLPAVLDAAREVLLPEDDDHEVGEPELLGQLEGQKVAGRFEARAVVVHAQCQGGNAQPPGAALRDHVAEGPAVQMGEALAPHHHVQPLLVGGLQRAGGAANEALGGSVVVRPHIAHAEVELDDVVAHERPVALAQARKRAGGVHLRALGEPHQKLVGPRADEQRRGRVVARELLTEQLGELGQDDVAEDEAVGLHEGGEAAQVDEQQPPLAHAAARTLQHRDALPHAVEPRDGVDCLPVLALELLALLLGDVADVAHENPQAGLRVVGDPAADRIPHAGALVGAGEHLHRDRALAHGERVGDLLLVGMGEGRLAHLRDEGVQGPHTAMVAAVHQLHRGVVGPVGEEDVSGALHRHAVALLLLAEPGFGAQLALGELLHHAVELVYLEDAGGAEALYPLHAALDALHKPQHRARHVVQRKQHDDEAQGDAHSQAQIKALVELGAQAVDGVVRHKAAHHPVLVRKGHVVAVKPQRGAHTVDGLVAQGGAGDELE